MTNSALAMYLATIITVTIITFYFFWRVLSTPPKKEPDSYVNNDDEPR
ncbi:MAG: hypothetical protein AB1458_12200 [Bacteroidota bacterium]